MKAIIGFSLLILGILFAAFVYNNLIDRDLTPQYDAVISSKVIDFLRID